MSREVRDHIISLIKRPTRARLKAEAMGFTFGKNPKVEAPNKKSPFWKIRLDFQCVCGTPETFTIRYTEADMSWVLRLGHAERGPLDLVSLIASHGAFTREHLLKDGFDPKRVDEMLAAAEAA